VPSLEINPYSWTKVGLVLHMTACLVATVACIHVQDHSCVDHDHLQVANILFVDTPVGAGFSFSRKPEGYNVGEISTSLQLHELLLQVLATQTD
jgi:hypothetical protein